MANPLNRRRFLQHSLLATSAATVGLSFEEQALLASPAEGASEAPKPPKTFPAGKIGKLSISRLVCGGNLISGFAHSRDLIYVSPLLKHYFTDAKVFETLSLCEQHGMNTAILRLDDNTVRLLKAYRKEYGSKLQWIAQVKLPEKDRLLEIKQAIDNGAVGAYVHGGVSEELVQKQQTDLIGKAVQFIKANGAIGGIAGHALEVPVACEKAALKPDFYLKTLNSKNYWSAGPMPRLDSVWEETPKETIAFMSEVERPWIAYKVLGAGAIHPLQGFQYAYDNGADFICAGIFDFQVTEDVTIARNALAKAQTRNRPWCA